MSVKDWVKKSVGFKSHVTICDKKPTIGWGRNLYDVGISKVEADYLFENDFNRAEKSLSPYLWFYNQPSNIQDSLLNLCFNMGIENLMSFKKMRAAILKKEYSLAAMELLNSSWAKKNEELAKDIAVKIREG
jgi:lysozyme